MAIKGFDSRYWNGHLPTGYDFEFYIAKATQNSEFVSPEFRMQWESAAQLGLKQGMYHYWQKFADSKSQARWYKQISDEVGGPGYFPPILDIEDPRASKSLDTAHKAWDTLDEMEQLFGQEVMVYTANWWWQSWIEPFISSSHPFYSRVLWEADPPPPTRIAWPDNKIVIVQEVLDWNAPGFNAGIDVNVITDVNWYNGLGGEEPNPEPPPGEEIIILKPGLYRVEP